MTATPNALDAAGRERERARLREAHLRPAGERPAPAARGLHHTAPVSSDVERSVRSHQDVLGSPLTEPIADPLGEMHGSQVR